MSDYDSIDEDVNCAQHSPPLPSPLDDDVLTGDGDQEMTTQDLPADEEEDITTRGRENSQGPMTHGSEEAQNPEIHGCQNAQEPIADSFEDNQAVGSDHEHEMAAENLDDEMEESDDDHEAVHDIIEQELDVDMAVQNNESQEYDEATMDGGQINEDLEQEDEAELMPDVQNQSREDLQVLVEESHDVDEAEAEAYGGGSSLPSAHIEEEPVQNAPVNGEPDASEPAGENVHEEDSSSLFIPENPHPAPSLPLRQAPLTDMPPRPRPTAPPSTPSQSMFARIKNMQKANAERRNAAQKQPTGHQFTTEPDNEAYLAAVMSGITPPATTPAPHVDEDEMADRQAEAEFLRQKRRYDELKRKNNGQLTFRQDVEWMKIRGTEKARRLKIERDLRYAQTEIEGEPELFPEAFVQTAEDNNEDRNDEMDDEIDLNDSTSSSRKRRRKEMPKKTSKPMSMQDAELHSMRVALEATDDLPKKKKPKGEANNHSPDAGPSRKGKSSKAKSTRTPRSKAPSKTATGGGRRTAKARREVDHAIKQATSLFTGNVFTQQAGADASEQPGWKKPTRNKQDALKELIASVPLEDKKQARSDMNGLIAATREFNGRGSVKPAGGGDKTDHKHNGWIVKGMKTSLKNYQVLGTGFMRRRENAVDEPKGGLMADQMGLGKTLMVTSDAPNATRTDC
jgi:hypothetical protein